MIWLTWRQFRVPATVALAALAAAVVLLLLTGPRLADDFSASGLADCAVGQEIDIGELTCSDLENQFLGRYPQLRFLGSALVALPALIGSFWGAPLLARELENGTHRLAWVQSVTRSRWLAVKLAVIGAVAVVVTAVLSLVFTWWSAPSDRLGSRIAPGPFAQRGVAPIAYAAFAFVLGVAVGAVVRRTVPAMAAALVGFVLVRQGVQLWVRPRLLDEVELRYSTFTFYGDDPPALKAAEGGWMLSTRTVDHAGQVLSSGGVIRDDAAARLCGLATASPTKEQLDACGEKLGLENVVSVLPADRFWALQAWETAMFVVLAIAVTGFCFWWVRRRIS